MSFAQMYLVNNFLRYHLSILKTPVQSVPSGHVLVNFLWLPPSYWQNKRMLQTKVPLLQIQLQLSHILRSLVFSFFFTCFFSSFLLYYFLSGFYCAKLMLNFSSFEDLDYDMMF